MQKDGPLFKNVQSGKAPEANTVTTNKNTHTQNKNITNVNQSNNCQQNTRRVRNIKPSTIEITSRAESAHSEENESLDLESTCYIREMMKTGAH